MENKAKIESQEGGGRGGKEREGGEGGAEEEKEEDVIIWKRKGIGGSKSQTKKFEYDENRLYIYTKYLIKYFYNEYML